MACGVWIRLLGFKVDGPARCVVACMVGINDPGGRRRRARKLRMVPARFGIIQRQDAEVVWLDLEIYTFIQR